MKQARGLDKEFEPASMTWTRTGRPGRRRGVVQCKLDAFEPMLFPESCPACCGYADKRSHYETKPAASDLDPFTSKERHRSGF
jgi:hypothetical protein